MVVWFLFGAMCVLVIVLILAYFKFASLSKQTQKAWQQLDHQLKFRMEFIPSIALSAASLSELDREFVYQLSAFKMPNPQKLTLRERVEHEGKLTRAFQKVFEAAKNHPELATDEHFSKLKDSIMQSEQKIQRAKKKYNSTAHTFNIITTVIPLNLIAKMFEMEPYAYFDFDSSL